MNSEKVKEIKKALEYAIDMGLVMGKNTMFVNIKLADILTLINELESENERLENKNYQLEQDLVQCENGYNLELHTARYQLYSVNEDLKKAQDRIAELENGNEALSFAVKQGFNDCKTKTLKQFAERLKEKARQHYADDTLRDFTLEYGDVEDTLKEFYK